MGAFTQFLQTLDPVQIKTARVTVQQPSFKQDWKASMSVDISGTIGDKVGFEVPGFQAEAGFISVEGKAGVGNTLNVSWSHSPSGETVELVSDKEVKGGTSVKSGITGKALNTEFTVIGVSAGLESKKAVSYGIKIPNYDANNSAQQRAVAPFFLGEALETVPNNLLLQAVQRELANRVYIECGCDAISGSATGITGKLNADVGKLKVNGTSLFTMVGGSGKGTVSMSNRKLSSGEKSKTASYKTETNLSILSGAIGNEEFGVKASVLQRDYLGRDISVTAINDKSKGKSVETTSLSAASTDPQILLFGKHTKSTYNKYTYAGEVDIGAGITIQSVTTARGDTYRDVPEDWFTVTNNANGTFTVTKNKDAQVNTGLKYRAVLSFRENVDGKKATVSLSVKSGEAKVSLSGTPVLYRSDRNSRGDFRLTVKDTGLNPLTRVTFKEAPHQALFTLYEYGGGNYALGFRDNTVQNKTYPTSVVLNLFFDGNTSTKPNATVTLKPQVR